MCNASDTRLSSSDEALSDSVFPSEPVFVVCMLTILKTGNIKLLPYYFDCVAAHIFIVYTVNGHVNFCDALNYWCAGLNESARFRV